MPSSNSYARLNYQFSYQCPANYRITNILNIGAYSAVYQCKDISSNNDIVLKCFSAGASKDYLREVGIASNIAHPNLTHCIDTFYHSHRQSCIIYEYISGGTLRSWLVKHGPLNFKNVIRCFTDLLTALAYLHDLKLIHCDIKPENVFMRSLDENCFQFVLGDFGSVNSFLEANYKKQQVLVTPAYVAPERLYDRFSYNSDLYSLGIMGFEMLTGHHPFSGSAEKIYQSHISKTPELTEIDCLFLRNFVGLLLNKNPKLRFHSAKSALHNLKQWESFSHEKISRYSKKYSPILNTNFKSPKKVSYQNIKLSDFQIKSQFVLSKAPDKLFIFQKSGQPSLGLKYQYYIQFQHTISYSFFTPTFTNATHAQVITDEQLAYSRRSQIFIYNFRKEKLTSVRKSCDDLKAFCYRNNYLLWNSRESSYFCNINEDTEINYRSKSYILLPQLCLLKNKIFIHSGGTYNQQATLRNFTCDIITTWNLGGPIIELTELNNTVLALVFDLETGQYAIWRLLPEKPHCKYLLPRKMYSWCSTPGHFFWTTFDQYLYMLNTDLQLFKLGQLPIKAKSLCVSIDHRFIAALSEIKNDHFLIKVWRFANDQRIGM